MKKILVLVRGYYPELSASGNLMKPLIEELAKDNKVYILSCSTKNEIGSFSKNIEFQKIKVKTPTSNLFKRLTLYIKKKIIVTYHNNEIVRSFKKEITSLDNEHDFDIILAVTYEEILALLSTDIPTQKKNVFLLEKLPISSNIPFISSLKNNYKKKVEMTIFKEMSRVYALPVMYSQLIQSIKIDKHKLIQLEHPMVTNRTQAKKNRNQQISLIYAGGLDRKQRNPSKIINFLKEIDKELGLKLVFYSYGNYQTTLNQLAKENSFLTSNQAVDSSLLEKEIQKSDFIITIGNKESDIVPSKIFDCISTGKPIIHFSQFDGDPYYKYLKKYDNSIILKSSEEFSEEDLKDTIHFLQENKDNIIDFHQISKNFEECTPSYVAKIITTI